MNLYQLYYFKTMAEMEHYTKAAIALSMTQPSLSHAISTLEDELGIPLFEKHGRNVKLTKYGKKFLPYVENALIELEAGTKKIKEMTDGMISIGFIYTLSQQFIPYIINDFINDETNNNIKFSLQEGRGQETCTASLVNGLKNEKFDLIFISLIPDDPEIEFIPICEQNLVALLPKGCPLADYETINLKDTEPYSIISYSGKIGLKQEINRLFEKVNILPNVSCEVEDELSMAGLVAANIGIAIVPDSPAVREYKNIQIRPIGFPEYSRKIYLGYIKNRHMTPSAQKFKEHIIESNIAQTIFSGTLPMNINA